jgi:hypothetical protein
MVQMVQDRRGYPGSLKRDQERRAKREWLEPSEPTQLDRIEAKLDALLDALADEGEEMEQPELTLDGEAVGGERDDTQPL